MHAYIHVLKPVIFLQITYILLKFCFRDLVSSIVPREFHSFVYSKLQCVKVSYLAVGYNKFEDIKFIPLNTGRFPT